MKMTMPQNKSDPFERLVRPEMTGLFRAAWRLTGNPADAEDLVQDTCIAANGHLAELEACAHPGRWLLRVLYNRFVDGVRMRNRSPVVALDTGADSPALASDALSPEVLACQEDSELAFARAWLALEEVQRAILALRAEGYGLPEIAEMTGIGKDVLAPRLNRARRSLRRHLDQQGNTGGAVKRLGSGR
jgi:RNA polymerase sigma-70 factor (ECF subfamily)